MLNSIGERNSSIHLKIRSGSSWSEALGRELFQHARDTGRVEVAADYTHGSIILRYDYTHILIVGIAWHHYTHTESW